MASTGPVKTRRPLRACAGVALISLACAASLQVGALGVRRDLGALSGPLLLLLVALCLVGYVAQLAVALLPPRGEVLPRERRALAVSLATLVVTLPLAIAIGVQLHPGTPLLVIGQLARFWAHALPCFLDGLLVAAVPCAIGMITLRRLVPRGSWRRALAVGGACGGLAGLAVALHCSRTDLVHVGLAHGAVLVAPAVLLALIGMRFLDRD